MSVCVSTMEGGVRVWSLRVVTALLSIFVVHSPCTALRQRPLVTVNVVAYQKGALRSPGFPGYRLRDAAGSHDYLLQCTMPLHDCRVRLEFTDLDLPCDSWLQIRHNATDAVPFYSLRRGSLCGATHPRPLLVSASHTLHLRVYIGRRAPSSGYAGFKVIYEGILHEPTNDVPLPTTADCDPLSLSDKTVVHLRGHTDCVWVKHVQPGHHLSVHHITGDLQVWLHQGSSSEAPLIFSNLHLQQTAPVPTGSAVYIRACAYSSDAAPAHFTLRFRRTAPPGGRNNTSTLQTRSNNSNSTHKDRKDLHENNATQNASPNDKTADGGLYKHKPTYLMIVVAASPVIAISCLLCIVCRIYNLHRKFTITTPPGDAVSGARHDSSQQLVSSGTTTGARRAQPAPNPGFTPEAPPGGPSGVPWGVLREAGQQGPPSPPSPESVGGPPSYRQVTAELPPTYQEALSMRNG